MGKMTVIDLFCGAGGFTQGFVDAGFVPIWANDFDPWSVKTYNENFGRHAICEDIREVTKHPKKFGLPEYADVVVGGPPCQGFSNLGQRLPDDPRNQLWRQYMKVVELVKPKIFVVENVPPLLKSEEFAEMCREAEDLGYEPPAAMILNAADFGVPQTRRRTIAVFSRIGAARLPVPTHSEKKAAKKKPWVPVRVAFRSIPAKPLHNGDVSGDERPLKGELLHIGRNPTPKSMKRYEAVPPGGNRWNLPKKLMPECWIKKTKGGTDLFGRLWIDRPSVTIRTEFFKPEKGRYLHPSEHRPITHWEAARIQMFPDTFKFRGSKIEIAKQIGNAVPVGLARAIADAVRSQLEEA
jgi:DNA (cytosine-5)-methyltransferase 1